MALPNDGVVNASLPADDFRLAMRRIAATVTILTTECDGRWGMTATSVCSLSTEPPVLVACVNRSADAYAPMVRSRRLCINALAADQAEVAVRFSGFQGEKGEQRFEGSSWSTHVTGAPVLEGAGATFDCRIAHVMDYGTHAILVCTVVHVATRKAVDPLVYLNQTFGSFSPLG